MATQRKGQMSFEELDGLASQMDTVEKNQFQISELETKPIIDDFDDIDQDLGGRVTKSGKIWSVSGSGYLEAKIIDRRLFSNNNNFYATLDYGELINTINCVFSLISSENANPTAFGTNGVTIIAQNDSGDLSTMIHCVFTGKKLSVDKRINNGSFINLLTVDYTTLKNGTQYLASITLEGDTIYITMPNGEVETIVDTDFIAINPTKATWQIGESASDAYVGVIHYVSVGEKYVLNKHALSGGASIKEVTWLKGNDLTNRKRIINHTVSTSGWYTIATHVNYGVPICSGEVIISARDGAGRVTATKLYISAVSQETMTNTVEFISRRWGAVTKARISDSGTAYKLDIYIPEASTNPCTMNIEFNGFFEVEDVPALSSGAYATIVESIF